MTFSSVNRLFRKFFLPTETEQASIAVEGNNLILTSEEKNALTSFYEHNEAEQKTVSSIADLLIAYAGAEYILSKIRSAHNPSNTPDALHSDSTDADSRLLTFFDVGSDFIILICNELAARIDKAPDDGKFHPEHHLNIQINRNLIPKDCDQNLPYLTDKDVATLRNEKDDNQFLFTLAAASSLEKADTIAGINKIYESYLRTAIVDNIIKFIGSYHKNGVLAKELGLIKYETKGKGKPDPFLNVLNALIGKTGPNPDLYSLSAYAVTVWIEVSRLKHDSYKQPSNVDANNPNMRKALGLSLHVINLPSQEGLFKAAIYAKANANKYKTLLGKLFREQGSLCSGTYNKNKVINADKLEDNFNKLLEAENLTACERAIIKTYISRLKDFATNGGDHSFTDLCKIDWSSKICKLFDTSARSRPKIDLTASSDSFLSLFIQEMSAQKDDNKITPEQFSEIEHDANEIKEIMASADSTSLEKDEIERLALFLETYKDDLSKLKDENGIIKEWNKLTYPNDTYEESNFLLSLAKCIMDYTQSSTVYGKSHIAIEHVELKLTESKTKLLIKNYAVATQFSIQYGSALQSIANQLPYRFFITGPDTGVIPKYAGSEAKYKKAQESNKLCTSSKAVLNYPEYFKSNKESEQPKFSVSKDSLYLKFELNIKSKGTAALTKYKILWSIDSDKPIFNIDKNLDQLLSLHLNKADTLQPNMVGPLNPTLQPIRVGQYRPQDSTVYGDDDAFTIKQNSSFSCYSDKDAGEYALSFNTEASLLDNEISRHIKTCLDDNDNHIKDIADAYERFKNNYHHCIEKMKTCSLTYENCSSLANEYAMLQSIIIQSFDNATKSKSKEAYTNILSALLKIGYAYPDSGECDSAIATPFAIEGMRSFTAKLKRLEGLIVDSINGKVAICQHKMFIDSIERDIEFYDAPELCLSGTADNIPMYAKENTQGYTLYRHINKGTSSSSSRIKNKLAHDVNAIAPIKSYTSAVISFLKRYISTRPLRPEQFTLMLQECRFPDICLGVYQALVGEQTLKDIKFQLVIVNKEVDMLSAVAKRFEQLRMSKAYDFDKDDKRIDVFILSSKEIPSNEEQPSGSFSNFLSANHITQDASLHTRSIDMSVLFHVFDDAADFKFHQSKVAVVSDEININPTLVNRSNANIDGLPNVGKYLVNPVQPLTRIQLFNTLGFIIDTTLTIEAIKSSSKHVEVQLSKLMNNKPMDCFSFQAYLPYINVDQRSFTPNDQSSEMIKSIHEQSDVVAFIDELQCRRLIVSNNDDKEAPKRIVYYNKLNNSRLNLLVSSTAERRNTKQHLGTLFSLHCGQTYPNLHSQFISAIEHDAVDISGSMLLRAENRQRNSYELAGNVMSKFITEQIMDYLLSKNENLTTTEAVPCPTFLSLDDYHMTLVGKQDKHADILCLNVLKYKEDQELSPSIECTSAANAKNRYLMIVSAIESKFLEGNPRSATGKSMDQTKESIHALFKPFTNGFKDRRHYLAIFADMLADNCKADTTDANIEFAEIQNLIREERVDIMFMGFSFVFTNNVDPVIDVDVSKSIKPIEVIASDSSVSVNNMKCPYLQIVMHSNTVTDVFKAYTESHCVSSSTKNLIDEWFKQKMTNGQALENYIGSLSSEANPIVIHRLCPNAEPIDIAK